MSRGAALWAVAAMVAAALLLGSLPAAGFLAAAWLVVAFAPSEDDRRADAWRRNHRR